MYSGENGLWILQGLSNTTSRFSLLWPRLSSSSQSSCLILLSVRIIGMYQPHLTKSEIYSPGVSSLQNMTSSNCMYSVNRVNKLCFRIHRPTPSLQHFLLIFPCLQTSADSLSLSCFKERLMMFSPLDSVKYNGGTHEMRSHSVPVTLRSFPDSALL